MVFTIENETNNITAHATMDEARSVHNGHAFKSESALAKLAANWPTARLVDIWNGIPGTVPVKKFTDRKAATRRIWKASQTLSESIPAGTATESEVPVDKATQLGAAAEPARETAQAEPEVAADQEEPVTGSGDIQPQPLANEVKADLGAQSPDVAPGEGKVTKKATRKTKTPTGETVAKAPRQTSKTSQVIAMLKREGGTTMEELMTVMGGQKHTTRALLSAGGSLTKKHGLVVISEKTGDKRVYSIKS